MDGSHIWQEVRRGGTNEHLTKEKKEGRVSERRRIFGWHQSNLTRYILPFHHNLRFSLKGGKENCGWGGRTLKLDDSAKFCHPVPISDRREKICQLAGKTLLSLRKKLVHHALFHASIVGRVIFTNQFLGKTRSRSVLFSE